jgi:serine protease Do
VTQDLAEGFGLDRPGGVVVNRVYPGGPADRAGLKAGDIILAVDGRAVEDVDAFRYRVATRALDGTAALEVWRGGRRVAAALPLETAPEVPARDETTLRGRHPLAGAVIANLSPALAEELDLPGAWEGVIIVRVVRGSPAHRLRFRAGDVILAVNGAEAREARGLAAELDRPAEHWRVEFSRDGRVRHAEFNL